MAHRAPRYDLPNAAPDALRIVQTFVNTVNLERGDEWLHAWLSDRGVAADEHGLARARVVREAIRELLCANNDQGVDVPPWAELGRAADDARLSIDFEQPGLVARADGVDGVIGAVLAASLTAMVQGTWSRLKVCRNHGCRWAFYDYSKNRSASWCSMQLCGNRRKTRAYRARARPRT